MKWGQATAAIILSILLVVVGMACSKKSSPPEPDTQAPSISDVLLIAIAATSTTITWTTDEPATSRVEYGRTSDYDLASQPDEQLVTSHSVTLADLSAATTYHFAVSSRDATANEATSQDYCLNTAISWESLNGPPGGRINQLVQSPYGDHELYAVAQRTVFKSEDRGDSWQAVDALQASSASFVAVSEDRVFAAGNGLYCWSAGQTASKQLDGWWSNVVVSNGRVFAVRYTDALAWPVIKCADLDQSTLDWKDISPSASELKALVKAPADSGLWSSVEIPSMVSTGDRILAGIGVVVEGSGELGNGKLYRSDDLGETWAAVTLDVPEDVIVTTMVQDPADQNHIVVAFKHRMMHEFTYPVSELLWESHDGGQTWARVTDLTMKSNGITDIDFVGSACYLANPFSGYILKLQGADHEVLNSPQVAAFPEIGYNPITLVFDCDDPQVVYGSTGGVWALGIVKSEDGMKTWEKSDKGIAASSRSIVIPHPTDANTLFASGNAVQESYVTRDGGATWEPFSPVNTGDEVRIDPHDPSHILYIDEMTRIYESHDSGRTLVRIAEEFSSAKILDFAVTKDGGKIYLSNMGVGISELTEQGEWRHMIGSPDYAYAIQIDPDDSSILYAANSPKIFEDHSSVWKYSKDEEANFGWKEVLRVENSRGMTSLEFDPSSSSRIYAAVVGEEPAIYVSNDKGSSWSVLNEDLTFTTIWGHSQLQIDQIDKNTVYAGTWGGGTFKTADGGVTWQLLDSNHTFSPTCIAISQKDPNVIYACDRTSALIHRSNDAGKTWYTYYDFGQQYMLTSAVAIDPTNPDVIYAAAFKPPMAHSGTLVKVEGGQKVADLSDGLPRSVLHIRIDEKNPGVLYVSTHIHGVFKSIDDGDTWQQLDDMGTGLPRTGVYDIEVDPVDSNVVYATALCGALPDYMTSPTLENLEGKCGVYKSTDGGAHWDLILETVSEARGIDIDSADRANLYVADMMGGVWASNDRGETWHQENEGLGSTSMTSVKVKDGCVYAATQGSGVYCGVINQDGSITWDASKANKPKARVYKIKLAIDPSNPNRIYASAYPGGLLRSDDGGKSWNDKNFLTPSIKVDDPVAQGYYSFDVSEQNPADIWLGAYGKGMFVSHDGMDYDIFADGAGATMRGKHITCVAINDSDSNEVWVGTQEGVFVTHDSGQHWESVSEGLGTTDIRSLKVTRVEWDPFTDDFGDGDSYGWDAQAGWSVISENGNYVLQGVGHNWVDAGEAGWTDYTFESKVKLVSGAVHVNFRKCSDGRYFVVFNEGGLYLKRQFNNWTDFADLAEYAEPYDLNRWYDLKVEVKGSAIKVYVDGALRIDCDDSFPMAGGAIAYESLDNSQVLVDDVRVTIDPIDKVYAGTAGYGLYKLDAASGTWQNLGRTLGMGWWTAWDRRMYQFSSIVFDPDVPGRVYYGHFPSGFFISEDNGHTWRDSSLGLGNDGIFSLTMHPTNHSILFGGTYNGVVKSVDGGTTWTLKNKGMPEQQWPFMVTIDSDSSNVMYAVTKNGQNKGFCSRNQFCGVVVKSVDGGENWLKIMNGLDDRSEFYTLLILPAKHSVLFLSTNKGVFLSTDSGSNWQPMNEGLPTVENQVRDNVAENLAFTADHESLILGLFDHGFWKADISGLDFACASFASDNVPNPNEDVPQEVPAASRRSYTIIYVSLASAIGLMGAAAVAVLVMRRGGKTSSEVSATRDVNS